MVFPVQPAIHAGIDVRVFCGTRVAEVCGLAVMDSVTHEAERISRGFFTVADELKKIDIIVKNNSLAIVAALFS